MAHKMSFVPRGTAIPGGVLEVELRLDPGPGHRSWAAAQAGFRWDPTKLGLRGQTAPGAGWAPRMRGFFPGVGFYQAYNETVPPADGDGVYTIWGPLVGRVNGQIPQEQMIPDGGFILSVFAFDVLSSEPSEVELVRDLDGTGVALADTIVYRADVAGMPYTAAELDLVSATVTPDASQTPPPTKKEQLMQALSDASMAHGKPGEQLLLLVKLQAAVNEFIGG